MSPLQGLPSHWCMLAALASRWEANPCLAWRWDAGCRGCSDPFAISSLFPVKLLVFATHPAMHAFPFLSFSCPHLLPQQSLLFFLLPASEAFFSACFAFFFSAQVHLHPFNILLSPVLPAYRQLKLLRQQEEVAPLLLCSWGSSGWGISESTESSQSLAFRFLTADVWSSFS